MTASVGYIICFGVGWLSGMAWIRASRADRADKLCATIAQLRAELADRRLNQLVRDIWAAEDDTP